MRVAFATDEETTVSRAVVERLRRDGHEVVLVAPGAEWPEAGRAVGAAVAGGKAERGVVCCSSGTGVAMAANKVPGVRAALCTDAETAVGARRWNDANVLAFGLRLTTETVASEMLDAFLGVEVDPEELPAIARLETEPPGPEPPGPESPGPEPSGPESPGPESPGVGRG